MDGTERFSSRWGLVAAALGMAIGAGNIWRFPRVAAAQGGGAFILAWLVALLVWSLPLLMIEYHLGRKWGGSPLRALVGMLGRHWAWAGGFIVLCCLAIMFYYSVVTGWCLLYLLQAPFLPGDVAGLQGRWGQLQGSWWAVGASALCLGAVAGVVRLGVRAGIEKTCRILVPGLFVLLVVAALMAITLPGARAGLQHLFAANFSRLASPRLWLEAFSQSAWSTGAGWGLLLVYAGYGGGRSHATSDCLIAGLGNNAASLLAALAVVPTLFALLPADEALAVAGRGNQGLAFVWLPRLFLQLGTWGRVILLVFLAALLMAAISSLIAMVELAVRALADLGWKRFRALPALLLLTLAAAIPSALWPDFFNNQDWVWGLGLLISGELFCAAALRRGLNEFVGQDSRPLTRWWFRLSVAVVIPLSGVAMLVWWFWQSNRWPGANWANPLLPTSLGTCLLQWGTLLLLLFLANGRLASRVTLQKQSVGS